MKALQIVHTAYRATTEEQDDTVVWLCHAMTNAGADLDVLLIGNAVNYAVSTQNSAGLAFGDWQQAEPPRLARDIASLIGRDVQVFMLRDDLADRGIGNDELIDGVEYVDRSNIAELFDRYDQVWRW